MPTTSNFGWNTPADTDLVKDGALAIRTLGNNIDTSLVDLKGGTTGQILSKNSNSDLDYTWINNDQGDITEVQAGTGISVASGTGPVPVITNTVATEFDAKGDLVVGTGADTFDKLTAGSNGDTLVADSSTTTGLRYNPLVNVNFAINGSFDFWQRGTSFTGVSDYYTADRWMGYRGGAAAGGTWSRQTASLDGFTYSMRVQRNSGNTSTAAMVLATSYETTQVRNLQGQFLTLSFWAKVGANFSGASSQIGVAIKTGTGTDGNLAAGFTGGANAVATGATLTTSWQRFSATTTAAIGSTITQLGIQFDYNPVGTAGANDWFEIAGVQLEVGQTATAWKRCGNTLAGELAACQRYYYRSQAQVAANFCLGIATNTTNGWANFVTPVTMRVVPTVLDFAQLNLWDTTADYTVTSLTIQANNSASNTISLYFGAASGLTANRVYIIRGQGTGTNGFIGLSAEL